MIFGVLTITATVLAVLILKMLFILVKERIEIFTNYANFE